MWLCYVPYVQLGLVDCTEFPSLNESCKQLSAEISFFPFLQKEKERIMENKRQVQSLVNKSKTIVRLKPRNPEEKSSSPVIVQALCDFKQDQVRRPLSHTHQTVHTGDAKCFYSFLCLFVLLSRKVF